MLLRSLSSPCPKSFLASGRGAEEQKKEQKETEAEGGVRAEGERCNNGTDATQR